MGIKVFIIDDSAVVREVMTSLLSKAPDITVIGTAPDPIFALQRLPGNWPDVIVLDMEMPRMDGLTFLRKLMAEHPTPVVVCSSLTEQGAQITFDAFSAGAVAVVTKPGSGVGSFLRESAKRIIDEVRAAASARVHVLTESPRRSQERHRTPKLTADAMLDAAPQGKGGYRTSDQLIAIATSTGGTQALEFLLPKLSPGAPGLVIVQHMPERFTFLFAQRLNDLCQIVVKEAANGDRVLRGQALIAPGGRHLLVKRNGAQYVVEVKDGPLVCRHRPSADVLFRSAAVHAGRNAIGVIMTGMGDDGARGLKEMHEAGARTIAQDEESCVVFGMPKVAIDLDAVDEVLSLDRIAATLGRLQ